ncbi:MAG: glycosyltransferase family 4 protein [Candidatus Zixiibacteriota bacterium]
MKVCHVVTAFARNEKDQFITPWMISMLKQQQNIGIDNTVFAPAWKGLKANIFEGIRVKRFRYFIKKFEVFSHDNSFPSQIKNNFLYAPLGLFLLFFGAISLARLLKKEDFDLVHIHWPLPLSLMTVFLPKDLPIVYTYYSAEIVFFKNLAAPLRWFFKGFIKKAKKHIVISSYTKEIFHKNFPEFEVITIPACHQFPSEIRDAKFPEKKPYRLLFVGRLVPRKGVRYLIEAMASLLEEIDVELTIIGDGVLFDELSDLAETLKVNDKVEFFGFVSHEEKLKTYYNSDLFVLPACFDDNNDTEGLGMVLVEALSYGCPVIASKVGGIVDIVKDGKTGLLFEEKSPEAIKNAVLTIFEDPELYMRLARDGAEFVKAKFDSKNIAKRIIKVYESAIR